MTTDRIVFDESSWIPEATYSNLDLAPLSPAQAGRIVAAARQAEREHAATQTRAQFLPPIPDLSATMAARFVEQQQRLEINNLRAGQLLEGPMGYVNTMVLHEDELRGLTQSVTRRRSRKATPEVVAESDDALVEPQYIAKDPARVEAAKKQAFKVVSSIETYGQSHTVSDRELVESHIGETLLKLSVTALYYTARTAKENRVVATGAREKRGLLTLYTMALKALADQAAVEKTLHDAGVTVLGDDEVDILVPGRTPVAVLTLNETPRRPTSLWNGLPATMERMCTDLGYRDGQEFICHNRFALRVNGPLEWVPEMDYTQVWQLVVHPQTGEQWRRGYSTNGHLTNGGPISRLSSGGGTTSGSRGVICLTIAGAQTITMARARELGVTQAILLARLESIEARTNFSMRVGISSSVLRRHRTLIQSLQNRVTTASIYWRGVAMTASRYLEIKALLRRMKQLTAQHHTSDRTSVFATEVSSLWNQQGMASVASNVIAGWNTVHRSDVMARGICGHVVLEDELVPVHGGHVCETCSDEQYQYAEDTGQRHQASALHRHSDGLYYTYSEDSDDEDDEDADDDDSEGGNIQGYSTNVLRVLERDDSIESGPYGSGDFLMGVELEVAPLRERRRVTSHDTRVRLCKRYAILKNDGSLSSGRDFAAGFEIVTAPRGLAEHLKRFGEWTPHEDLRAWDSGKCGMHVHLSSRAFTKLSLGKFIEFINHQHNDKMILRIAGRTPHTDAGARDYCQRDGEIATGNPKDTLKNKSTSRYYMVNTNNLTNDEVSRLGLRHGSNEGKSYNTIELRIFKATLSKPRLLAQIEFAHAAVCFCREASMQDLTEKAFCQWLARNAGQYPHLARWMGVAANRKVRIDNPKILETADL